MKKAIPAAALLCFSLGTALPAAAGRNPLKGKETAEDQKKDDREVAGAVASFKNRDPGMKVVSDEARGYAIFPTAGMGGSASAEPAARGRSSRRRG